MKLLQLSYNIILTSDCNKWVTVSILWDVLYARIGFSCGAGPELFMVVFLYNVLWYKSTLYIYKMLCVDSVNTVWLLTGWTAKNVGSSCCPQLYRTVRRYVMPMCYTYQTHAKPIWSSIHMWTGLWHHKLHLYISSQLHKFHYHPREPCIFFLYLTLSIPHHHHCQHYFCGRRCMLPIRKVTEVFV